MLNSLPSLDTVRASRGARWVVRLLCFALAPVLIIALPGSASAVVKYSPGHTIKWQTTGQQENIPGWGIDCKWPVYTVYYSLGADPVVQDPDGELYPTMKNGHCELGVAVSNDHDLSFEWNGTSDELGASCSSETGAGGLDIGGVYTLTGDNFVTDIGQNAPDCDVSEVCWTLTKTDGEQRGHGCEGVEMPSPMPQEAEPQSCYTGTGTTGTELVAMRPALAETTNTSGQGRYITFQAQTGTGTPLAATGWFPYVVSRRTAGTGGYQWFNVVGIVSPYGPDTFMHRPQDAGGFTGFPYQGNARISNGAGTTWEIMGFGYVYIPKTNLSTANVQRTPQDSASGGSGLIGVTDPARCAWYWGTKVAETVGNDYDEPIGPVVGTPSPGTDTPPDPDPEEPAEQNDCNFHLDDPSTWASGAVCALVGLMRAVLEVLGDMLGVLGDILAAIGGLVAALVSAIGDLLSALFIPGDGFFESKADTVNAGFSNTSYDEWKDLVTSSGPDAGGGAGFAAAQSSTASESFLDGIVQTSEGCRGPVFVWERFDSIPGVDGELAPLDACGGTPAQLASLCRIVLMCFIGISAAFKAVGLIAESMGAQKNMGMMLSNDWSGAKVR